MNIDLSTIAAIFGILATIITGAVWVMSLVNKVTAKVVTQGEHINNLKEQLCDLKEDTQILKKEVNSHEEKNAISRHDFKTVTTSVYGKIDDLEKTLTNAIDKGFQHINELFNTKIKNLEEKISEKK